MDFSQAILRNHHHEEWSWAMSESPALPNPCLIDPSSQDGYTNAQIALLLIPSVVLLLLSPIRVSTLHRASLKVLPNYTGSAKATATVVIAAAELVALLLCVSSTPRPGGSIIIVNIAFFLADLAVCPLSFLEHGRSFKPSTLLNLYLLTSIPCEGALLRPIYLHGTSVHSTVRALALSFKLALLLLEIRSKRSFLRDPWKTLPVEQTSSDLNRVFLVWTNRLIVLGSTKLLSNSDLPGLDDGLKSRYLRIRMREAWDKAARPEHTDRPSGGSTLLYTLLGLFKGSLLLNTIPRLVMIAFRYSQPIFIASVIRYVTEPTTSIERCDSEGYRLILAAFVIYVGLGASFSIYYQGQNRIKVQTRGALVGLIHAQSLTLRDGACNDAAAITHMSSDTETLEDLPWLFQETWAQMVELLIGMAMLCIQLGWWSLVPLAIVALFSQVARWTGSTISESMANWQKAKQQRIALTTSVVDHIRNIKMMGLSDVFMAKVQESRMKDLVTGLDYRWIVVYFNLAVNGVGILAPTTTLIFYAIDARLRGKSSLDPTTAFTSIAIITLVTTPANTLLTLFPRMSAVYSCATRIQRYLLEPPRDDRRVLLGLSRHVPSLSASSETRSGHDDWSEQPTTRNSSAAVILKNVVLRPAVGADICLDNISAQLDEGSLTVIHGAIGTGKTTLARAILGDVTPDHGSLLVSTKRIAYCAQRPWVTHGTMLSIICGGETEIDSAWYKTVVYACALQEDFGQLADGDLSIVGSRGVALSGGQRQRLALARAVYTRPEIIILDDILSALDRKTEAHIAAKLLGPDGIFRKQKTTVILITHSAHYLPMADEILILANSKIEQVVTWDELRYSTGYDNSTGVGKPEHDVMDDTTLSAPTTSLLAVPDILDFSKKTGDFSVYLYYFKCVSLPVVILFLGCNIADGAALAITPSILRAWTEARGAHMWLYTTMYGLSSLMGFVATGSMLWSTLILIAPKAGEVLHYRLLETIMRAPLSYFAVTNTGETLNRFTEDMNYVDHSLPYHLMTSSWQFSKLISQLILLFITQGFVAVGIPFIFLVLYFLQKLYLYTSRQVRILDIELRANVLSDFLETLEGIAHIRAFNWESEYINQNIKSLDESQRPYYAMLCIQQWLTLVLDMLVAGLAVLVVSITVIFKASTTGGQIGVALNVVLTISATLTRFLQGWTQLETSLGAVLRIKTLEECLEPEYNECESLEPPPEWPHQGAIEFKEVFAAYDHKAVALKGISVNILPGYRVGICGRTGSGKSTLLLSILRLVELVSGSITIDGVDLRAIPRETIRARINTIPQDTSILNDSIRLNVDPSGSASDEEIIAALERVQLWNMIRFRASNTAATLAGTTPPTSEDSANAAPAMKAEPLDSSLGDLPLSHGQLQLLGLARALILRNRSRILVIDEATSNVDAKTDELMQRIIRQDFTQHTILTVAHRLNTIKDADTILVMDKGRIVEVGTPAQLLAKDVAGKATSGKDDDEAPGDKAWFREMWNDSQLK